MSQFVFAPQSAVALALLAAIGLARPAPAGELVPLKGDLSGTVTHTTVAPGTDYVVVDAAGTATVLGGFTVTAPHYVNTTTRIASGYYEFTAASGDTVYATFTGQARPTETPGVISIVETATITGGTGRFAGATGAFVVKRLFDRAAGTTTGSFEGTISPPRSVN